MCQIFIILLRASPQNNAKLKPVRSAKKVADPDLIILLRLSCRDNARRRRSGRWLINRVGRSESEQRVAEDWNRFVSEPV